MCSHGHTARGWRGKVETDEASQGLLMGSLCVGVGFHQNKQHSRMASPRGVAEGPAVSTDNPSLMPSLRGGWSLGWGRGGICRLSPSSCIPGIFPDMDPCVCTLLPACMSLPEAHPGTCTSTHMPPGSPRHLFSEVGLGGGRRREGGLRVPRLQPRCAAPSCSPALLHHRQGRAKRRLACAHPHG